MASISRREFIVSAAAKASSIALAGTAAKLSAAGGSMTSSLLAIGNSVAGEKSGIHMFRIDLGTGSLTPIGFTPCERPSFTLNSPDGKMLYAVGESAKFNGKPGGSVSAYAVGGDGSLTFMNAQSSGGAGPCHLCLYPSGKYIIASNYSGGSVGVLPIAADGKLLPPSCVIQQSGKGPNPKRQTAPHMHSATVFPDGVIAVADLGLDKIFLYRLENGELKPHTQPYAECAPGAGVRWLAVHPKKRIVFAVNELDCTVDMYRYENASLVRTQTEKTIADEITPEMSGASIRVSPDGQFLYVSTRGHNSISVFAIAEDGSITLKGVVPSAGSWPRDFALSQNGELLVVANQRSDCISVFRRGTDGSLIAAGITAPVSGATSVLFFQRA